MLGACWASGKKDRIHVLFCLSRREEGKEEEGAVTEGTTSKKKRRMLRQKKEDKEEGKEKVQDKEVLPVL